MAGAESWTPENLVSGRFRAIRSRSKRPERHNHGHPNHSGRAMFGIRGPPTGAVQMPPRLSDDEIAILERFERLPDSAAVSLKICALVSGISGRTWRRNPPIPTFPISAGKKAVNVGLLRKLTRGELAPSAA